MQCLESSYTKRLISSRTCGNLLLAINAKILMDIAIRRLMMFRRRLPQDLRVPTSPLPTLNGGKFPLPRMTRGLPLPRKSVLHVQ